MGITVGQNQTFDEFDEFSKSGIPIVYRFVNPLLTKISCPIDGVKLDKKQNRWR